MGNFYPLFNFLEECFALATGLYEEDIKQQPIMQKATLRLGLTLLLATTAHTAYPQEQESEIQELGALFITPSRTPETDFEAPYHLERIDSVKLVERAARTVPEIFEFTPGVVVQKTAHGQGSPYIRGVTAYHNLFLIDGIRLNNAAFRSGPNQYWGTIDAQGLSAVELVKSQGSVLFGSDSVGGTVQAFTHNPIYANEGSHSAGRSYTRYATAENSFIQRGEYSQSEAGKYGLIIGGTYKDFGDIDAADLGELPFTGYDEQDMDAKLEWFLNPDTKLTVFHQQVNIDDAWRVHKTIHSQSWAGTSVGNELARILDQDRALTYIQLEGISSSHWFERYKLSISHHRHQEERFRERTGNRLDLQGFELNSYGAWAQLEKSFGNTDMIYGASYYQDKVDSYKHSLNTDRTISSTAIQGPVGDDGTYHLASLFFNNATALSDRLSFDWGARYTHAEADIEKVQDPETGNQISIQDDWDRLVGSGRISYQLDEAGQFRLFGGLSQAFRTPGFSDLSRLDSNRSNEIETPSPNLKPEKYLTSEIGIKVNNEKYSGSLSYFYTNANDMILRTPTGDIVDGDQEVIKSNVGDGHVQGVELAGTVNLNDSLRLFGGFAYQDSSVSTFPTSDPILVDEVLSRLMPTNGHIGLRQNLNDNKAWIEGLVTIFGEGDRLNTRDQSDTQRIPPGGTPEYQIFTLRGGYWFRDNILLTAAVENIFDEAYRAHGSGQNEPGTNFVFGAEIKF